MILVQVSPLARKPFSQISGQTRPGLVFTASSISGLVSLTSNFVPACLLNKVSARCEVGSQSPVAAASRHPTRRNSNCSDVVTSLGDKLLPADGECHELLWWLLVLRLGPGHSCLGR